MKYIREILVLVALMIFIGACQDTHQNPLISKELSVIPQPTKVKIGAGNFTIEKSTVVYCNSKDLLPVAKQLNEKLSGAFGFSLKIQESSGKGINLLIADVENEKIGFEGYKLHITEKNI